MKTDNTLSREAGFNILEQQVCAVIDSTTGRRRSLVSGKAEELADVEAFISENWEELLTRISREGTVVFSDPYGREVHIFPGPPGKGEFLLRCYKPGKGLAEVNDLFEKNVAGSYEISHSGKVLKCNKSFAAILGIDDPSQLLGRNISEFYLNPSLRDSFLEEIDKKGVLQNYEILLRRADGKVAWCIENSYLIRQNGGESAIAGTLVEVTEEKLAREKYSQLFAESTDAILIFDPDKVIDCNKRTEEIFRSNRDSLLGMSVEEMVKSFVDDDSRKIDLLDHKVMRLAQGEKQQIRLKMRRSDATEFHAELYLVPFEVLGEQYIQVIIHDVSERVLFENTIRESEERFRLISKVAIEGVVFTDEGKIADCNEQFIRMIGFRDRKDIMGRAFADYIAPEDLERLRINMELNLVTRMELRARNESGETMVLEASGSRIFYQDRPLEAFLLYDITSRKRAEQALEQSKDRFKGLVENSPNGVFILTDGLIKYANYSALKLLGFQDEDDVYNKEFTEFFGMPHKAQMEEDLDSIREGEEVEYREVEILDRYRSKIDVGIRSILTVYDNRPSIQITVNNLQTERLLIQEKLRAQLAEEINTVLKKEIEEHKETQRKLEAAQSFTRNIIESSLDMIIAVDHDNRITEFNRSASEFFGYAQEEVLGEDVQMLFATEKDFRDVQQKLGKRGFFSGELLNLKKSGEAFNTYLSASLIRNQDGEVLGSMGVSRDITELKRAEMELRASEERYRDIFENTKDFILSFDKKGRFIYANNAFCEATGYSSGELQEMNIRDLCVEPRIPRNRSIFSVLSERNIQSVWNCRNGESVIARGDISISYQGKNPHSLRGIFRNVTEEEEQKARLDSIFDSTENMLMWTVDEKFRITSSNKNFRSVFEHNFGVSIGEGSNFVEAIRPVLNLDLYQSQMDNYHESFKGRARQFELPLLDKKGAKVWLQLFLNPVHYGGQLEEVSCISYDVTERKEIDRRIRDALKEKEVLLQEVHHRVKNNLQVISSILNLQSGYVEDPRTLEILKESQNRIKSMSFIHETLYQTADFSSIEFPDYINTLTRNLIHSYITDKPVRLETEFDEVYLGIDQAIPCGLIVNELVSNALKYAYKGVGDPRLYVGIKEKGREISLRVKDNGIGFPKDFRYEESNSLGIQLVYTLVDQLDASIEMKSEGGADIIITFERVQ